MSIPFISKKEWYFVLVFSIIIMSITLLPYLYAIHITPPNFQFMGQHQINTCDTYTYIAWIQQANEGHFLFKDPYCVESQRRILFHPLFLVMGHFARIFNFSNIFTYHLFRIFFGFIFLFIAYIFISYFLKGILKRGVCFLLLTFSSGFGWIVGNYSIDLWQIETITFLNLLESPLNLLSLILMLTIFILTLEFFKNPKLKYAVGSGIALLSLSLIHTYDIFIVWLTIGFFIFLKFLIKDLKPKITLKYCFIMAVILLPGILYDYYAINNSPSLKWWFENGGITLNKSFLAYISGFGLIFFLALIGILKIIKNKNWNSFFILAWIIASSFLSSQSFLPFQRKFTEGLHIPMVILATLGLFLLSDYLKNKWTQKGFSFSFQKVKVIFLSIIISFTSLSNINVVLTDIALFDYFSKNQDQNIKIYLACSIYLDKSYLEAVDWLKNNTHSSEIVLSGYSISNLIPGLSGNIVFAGYIPRTINISKKMNQLKHFIEDDEKKEQKYKFLKKYKIAYLLYSPDLFTDHSSDLFPDYSPDFFYNYNLENFHPEKMEYLKPVYKNEKAVIYKVL